MYVVVYVYAFVRVLLLCAQTNTHTETHKYNEINTHTQARRGFYTHPLKKNNSLITICKMQFFLKKEP